VLSIVIQPDRNRPLHAKECITIVRQVQQLRMYGLREAAWLALGLRTGINSLGFRNRSE
jgi:hypothetical protein